MKMKTCKEPPWRQEAPLKEPTPWGFPCPPPASRSNPALPPSLSPLPIVIIEILFGGNQWKSSSEQLEGRGTRWEAHGETSPQNFLWSRNRRAKESLPVQKHQQLCLLSSWKRFSCYNLVTITVIILSNAVPLSQCTTLEPAYWSTSVSHTQSTLGERGRSENSFEPAASARTSLRSIKHLASALFL